MEKGTMTVNELQAYLGIGRRQAYELANSKAFPSFRIGRKLLINKDRLSEWMKKQEEKK